MHLFEWLSFKIKAITGEGRMIFSSPGMVVVIKFSAVIFIFCAQGCEKKMEHKPQDFFEGEQLEIAQIIYDGNEPELKNKIASINSEVLNYPAKDNITLLFWSLLNAMYDNISPERLQIISDMVKAGADPLQPRPAGGSSPAEFAMRADKNVWIKALLNGGLSPNSRDKIHHEPIIFESRYARNTETLKALLDNGADIDIRDSLDQTLLMGAFISSSFEHVKLLLARGANPNPVDANGLSLLAAVTREIKDSKEGTEYNNKCKEILKLMMSKGVKE